VQIKRLRLTGFKSFVEPSELRIEPGLTGIVGPNGCGKSNLLEAIRWVMGESSPKSMRGGAMDDVIFAGTATRPSRDFAEVSLHCDTEGDLVAGLSDPKDSDELEVIRRIDRGAGSAYRANGRDVRAKDIALIFADAATGAHSPALVSQGKIAHIISARPTERRLMLEEAAGISGLHVRRKDAEQKLKATENNLSRLGEIVAEMEKRAASLRGQARTAEKYREISAAIRTMEARLIYVRWREASAAAEAARNEAKTAEGAVLRAQNEIESLAAQQRSHATFLAELRIEVQKLRVAFADISAEFVRIESEERSYRMRLEDLQRQHQAILEDRAREDELGKQAHEALSALEAEAKDLGRTTAASAQERSHLVKADQRAHHNLRDAELALARAQAKSANETAERRVLTSARDSALTAQKKAAVTCARLQGEREKLGESAALDAAQAEAAAKAETAETAASAAEAQLSAANEAREQAAQTSQQAEAHLAEARAARATLESDIAALEKALASSASSADRLIDQISVAAGYESAVAAALGEDLQAGTNSAAPRHWSAAVSIESAAAPAGCTNLRQHVSGPDVLLARLGQIFVADQDDGQTLAVGQRLVTRDGAMRRWDGFRTTGDGATAREQLVRRNRLDALKQIWPSVDAEFTAASTAHRTARSALTDAQSAADSARKALAEADSQRRAALRAADQAQTALDRHQQALRLLTDRQNESETALQEADALIRAQQTALDALPDDQISQSALRSAEDAQQSARRFAGESRSHLAEHDQASAARSQRQAVVSAEIRSWKSRAGEGAKRIAEMDRRTAILATDIGMLAEQPAKLQRQQAIIAAKRETLETALRSAEAKERESETALAAVDSQLTQLRDASASLREVRAGAMARFEAAEQRRNETGRASGERFGCPPPLLPSRASFDLKELGDLTQEHAAHEALVADRDKLGPVNLVAADEVAALEAERRQIVQESDELQQAVNQLRGSIGNLNREGRTRLLAAFEAVNGHFQRLFTDLFGGGTAHLEMVDSDDPLEAGLEIMAQPPGKRLGALTLLSGGEQALTAIALIFGLFLTNPAPICVLDEVDAPLDDANVERFCNLLDLMVRETRTRYMIVTHNAVTMARMHRLYGVTMVERGVSRLVSVDLESAENFIAAE
jgi:chromosome segregation protein